MTLEETLEADMKRKKHIATPLHDYRPALEGALSWLGNRYLLAEPVPRLSEEQKPYFAEQRRWHPSVVAGALAKTPRCGLARSNWNNRTQAARFIFSSTRKPA